MIAAAELQAALRSVEAAPAFAVGDLAERVAADRVAAGLPALPPDELHEACRVFFGRTFGFRTLAEHEADVQQRIAAAKREGPEALERLADELDAEAAGHAARADVVRVELIRRDATGAK